MWHDRRVRRLASALVLLALAAGAATIARAAGSPAPMTRARAQTLARAVTLRAGDLPGATLLRGAVFGPEAVQYEALRCTRGRTPGVHPVVGAAQSWLDAGRWSVDSIVAVVASGGVVEKGLRQLESRRGRRCLVRALGGALTFERDHRLERSRTVKAVFVPIARLGSRATALHVVATVPPIEGERPSSPRRPKYLDVEGAFFGAGPVLIAFYALGATPLPAATETRLLALLRSRAETALR
jgi:hypothetical protein